MPNSLEMKSDLIGTTSFWLYLYHCTEVEVFQYPVVASGWFSLQVSGDAAFFL